MEEGEEGRVPRIEMIQDHHHHHHAVSNPGGGGGVEHGGSQRGDKSTEDVESWADSAKQGVAGEVEKFRHGQDAANEDNLEQKFIGFILFF